LDLKEAVDIAGGALVLIDDIRPIRDQSAVRDEEASIIDRWQPVPGRKRDDQFAMYHRPSARGDDQTTIWAAGEGGYRALDFSNVAQINRAQLHTERRCNRLKRAELTGPGGNVRIANACRSRHAGSCLLEQLQPFPADAVFE